MPSIMDAFLGDWLIEYSAARCQQCRWLDYCTKISVSKLLRYRERQRRALRKWDAKVIVATPGKQEEAAAAAAWRRCNSLETRMLTPVLLDWTSIR
ncbi:hypothetical protein BHM03_00030249 [Ensete ventricosum]|uniref:Uncharacterized protein n=1 Tax=Ensete ventricosum TaxID=4639 RepID=A0A445MIG8_ENSVE|nr:hypothetical protein BHM03_00030249 [Ensete ventricosum]